MSDGIDIFLTDDVGSGSVDRAIKLLAGIKRGSQKAIGSAMKRAATSGESHAARAVAKDYYISAGDFKKYTKSKKRIVTNEDGASVEIEFRGYHIPLAKFDTKVGADGRVSTRVKRSSARAELEHVFFSKVGSQGHEGLFERLTGNRLPIEEKFGPSTPQMMEANDDVAQSIGDKIREVFESRLDHEVLRVLNGWGT